MWWSPKVEEFRCELREFADGVVAPAGDRMDNASDFEPSLLQQLKDRKLLSMLCPREFGGPGSDTCLAGEVVSACGAEQGSATANGTATLQPR